MNTHLNTIQPTARMDSIDFIIVSNRGTTKITQLFKEAAASPEKWMAHHFIVVYDTEEECRDLKAWVAQSREFLPLPRITPCLAAPQNCKNVNALRAQGMEQGTNAYVYFQDDDDPLPEGLERRIKMMESSTWVAIYGITRNISARGQIIEEFPVLVRDNFAYDPNEATRMFPTYAHPLAALFKRDLFKKVPICDENIYNCSGSNAFSVRLFASNLPVHFLPDLIRTVRDHAGNSNGIFESGEAENLAADIQTWSSQLNDVAVETFQKEIAEALIEGTITTYREIDAQVETRLEGSS
ncbi:MAG: hypothetical protein ACI9TY_000037 [Alphaproteobacteria bacterium]|jgi:hypothetical protein